jgi:phosphotriesterase-related protein
MTGLTALSAGCARVSKGTHPQFVQTVLGPVPPDRMSVTLAHEHVMVDFIGAAGITRDRYRPDEVFQVAQPHLQRIKELGCQTLVECTPAYIGRDPELLRRLALATGLNILTNTGYYGAGKNKYLPEHALTESAEQLSARWIREAKEGIEGTGIRPGFMKIGVDAGPLSEVHRKLVSAAARSHWATGLTIAAHTGNGVAALE